MELFGDEIEQIKSFDIDSQRSIGTIERVTILPVTEPSGDTRIPSLVNGTSIFVDAFPSESPPSFLLAGTGGQDARAGRGEGEAHAYDPEHALSLSRFNVKGEGYDAGMRGIRGLGIYPEERKSLGDIAEAIATLRKDHRIVIVSPSEAQAERVKEILFDGGVVAPLVGAEDLMEYEGSVAITRGKLSSGFFMPGLLVLTEREIFGERPPYRPLKQSKVSRLLASMDDISPGDLVVHPDHGIGRFLSVQKERTGDFEHELIVLEYAGNDRLYIPLYNIDRIKKYNAEEGAVPLLDRLGGKCWQRRRERVRKAVREMAEKLLKLYAERAVAKSSSFSADTELHREFYGFFPYEETPDQVKAAEEIGRDMESERPMDRLLCGDVGYGKTEVAMRAAFKAVYDGTQVAVLVPTTILCEQHYHTFKARFSAFPVKIDYLSRFKPKRERDATLHAVARGEVDIIVGTHSLLRKGISFCNLGLLIIDEEHRFGVGQKERIKELKQGIDILSMTATPIPRTLHMAISGIRAMSVIETPPEERLAVRSMVSVFDEALIKEAMEREFQRGGQVLFVHNAIFDIEKVAALLRRLLPDARFGIAHGQMPERRLEEVMLKFIKRETDVLVSTTIIGSGIDIPTANTILINRADRIGLSDLYQLRGRVGRSNVRAYAYFLIPGKDLVSEDAKKRLQAISEMSYLGAGFRLAMKDLEMRGAGNLLGPQQSGHIHAVGFDLYVEMLEKAVAELKGIEMRKETEPSISLKVAARIPEEYIEDMTVRMSVYRRIANAPTPEDLSDIEAEMTDRFGAVPDEVGRLLDIMRLKSMAKRLSILKISETDRKIRVVFSKDTPVATEKVLGLQKTFHGIRFHRDGFELNLGALVKPCDSLSVSYDLIRRLN
jgi:transcription-repair coupling factor (superfamily II helicase)